MSRALTAATAEAQAADEREFWITVWHEAGHGLINRVHGLAVESLQALRPSEHRSGRRVFERDGTPVQEAWGLCDDETQPWIQVRDGLRRPPVERDWVLAHIAANVAGPVVEHLWRHDRVLQRRVFWTHHPLRGITSRHCQDDDLRDACANAALLYPQRSAQNWLVRQQVHRISRYCQAEPVWQCLTRIAEALAVSGYLSGVDLDALIELSPDLQNIPPHATDPTLNAR
jgi:hypothetical protein